MQHHAGKNRVGWLLFGLCAAVMPAIADDIVLADFQADDGSSWQLVNDTVMGGRSSSDFRIENGALHFSGTLSTNGGGFASVRSGRLNVSGSDQDVIRLRVKGDGRQYQLRLYCASTGTTYRATFDTRPDAWQLVELPLPAFQATWRGRLLNRPPIRSSEISGLGILLADGQDGAFTLALSWVKLTNASEFPNIQ